MADNEKAKILVIDDQIDNVELARINLEMEGFAFESASNGKEGLEKSLSYRPDVIVLDVMMPVMDGWEACRLLKKDERTKNIPVLMLTAKAGVEDIVRGLDAGATEYLVKPYHVEELLVRVKTLARIKKAEDRLKAINADLERQVKERTKQLLMAARFEVLGKLAGGITHDLNNMLNIINGINQLCLSINDIDEIREQLETQARGINLMTNFSMNLKRLAGRQQTEKKFILPSIIIKNTLNILETRLKTSSIFVETNCPENIHIFGDESQYSQICINLLLNSIDAIGKNGKIEILLSQDGDFVLTRIKDNGAGIPPENMNKIFDLLFTTKPEGEGTGIGLFTFKKIVKDHGGRIDVQSEVGKGTAFSCWLPAATLEDF